LPRIRNRDWVLFPISISVRQQSARRPGVALAAKCVRHPRPLQVSFEASNRRHAHCATAHSQLRRRSRGITTDHIIDQVIKEVPKTPPQQFALSGAYANLLNTELLRRLEQLQLLAQRRAKVPPKVNAAAVPAASPLKFADYRNYAPAMTSVISIGISTAASNGSSSSSTKRTRTAGTHFSRCQRVDDLRSSREVRLRPTGRGSHRYVPLWLRSRHGLSVSRQPEESAVRVLYGRFAAVNHRSRSSRILTSFPSWHCEPERSAPPWRVGSSAGGVALVLSDSLTQRLRCRAQRARLAWIPDQRRAILSTEELNPGHTATSSSSMRNGRHPGSDFWQIRLRAYQGDRPKFLPNVCGSSAGSCMPIFRPVSTPRSSTAPAPTSRSRIWK